MKGLIFTEFIEMVEEQFGFETADKIIQNAKLQSEGVYTAVGTYPIEEMIALILELEKESGIEVPDLINHFGKHLFHRFSIIYSDFVKSSQSTFEFLSKIENYIHVEVLKLYPDALLPSIVTKQINPLEMELIYESPRKLHHLAHGLIMGCAEYFGENIEIQTKAIHKDESEVKFSLKKK